MRGPCGRWSGKCPRKSQHSAPSSYITLHGKETNHKHWTTLNFHLIHIHVVLILNTCSFKIVNPSTRFSFYARFLYRFGRSPWFPTKITSSRMQRGSPELYSRSSCVRIGLYSRVESSNSPKRSNVKCGISKIRSSSIQGSSLRSFRSSKIGKDNFKF